jgi:hypothetical protein
MDDVWGFAGFFKFFQVAESGKERRKKGEMYIIICKYLLARNLRISLTDQRAGTDTILKG